MVARYVGTNHAVATVNGTSALHIALLVAGIEPDDEALVSTLTFIAPANAIRYAGAWPVFIDAEPEYWQMSPRNAADFLEHECGFQNQEVRNKRTGRRVKAIMPVHILGHPVDMDPIMTLARKYNLLVIEDATESPGAEYKGDKVGRLGDIACFSFNGNKILTTGSGGMIVTDNETWARKARYLTTQAKDNPVEFIHREIGYNYRLSNIQAAMGCAQMEKLDEYIAAKRGIAAAYNKAFAEMPGLTPMPEAAWASSIFWMYTLLIDESEYGQDSRQLLRGLQEAKIQTRPLWEPLHRSIAHTQNHPDHTLPVADRLNRQALSLPCSVGITPDDQQRVIEFIIRKKR
jgi:perosamine synthetase